MREITLEKTCNCCPEQYWAHIGTKTIGYIRLRWGRLTCDYLPSGKPQLAENDIRVLEHMCPMSSMTEEEKKDLQEIAVSLLYNKDDIMIGTQINSFRQLDGVLDLFNSHHLDWRGLIEKNLALVAPEGMYNTK